MKTQFPLLCAICLWFFTQATAQNGSIQDCLGAIPVCRQIYQETQAPIGFGNQIDFNTNILCLVDESNSIWYTFKVNNDGPFGFVLKPNDPTMDYDWALFDITNANCAAIFDDPDRVVSCNAAGGDGCHGETGATGASMYATQGANCGTSPPTQSEGFSPFNDLIDVKAGNTYALIILNYTGSNAGYTLDFGLSADIGIFDDVPPVVEQVAPGGDCGGDVLEVQFSEFIQCHTIDETKFALQGPGGPFTLSLSSLNCTEGGNFAQTFQLNISPALSEQGDYSLDLIVDGSSEALDLCGNPAASQTLSFSFSSSALTVELGPDTTLCPGQSLVLDAGPEGTTYNWQDGSTSQTLDVLVEGTYAVTVTTSCGQAQDDVVVSYSEAVDLMLSDTTLCIGEQLIWDLSQAGATYLWQDGSTDPIYMVSAAGEYSVVITTTCESMELQAIVDMTEAVPPFSLGPDTTLCEGATITLTPAIPVGTYSWQDGSTDSSYLVGESGDYALTISNSCSSESSRVRIDFLSLPTVELGPDTFLCNGGRLLLDVTAIGAAYLWQDGSTAANYPVSTAGLYSVTVTNACGETTDELRVNDCTRCQVFIPNAISPNGDGVNDLLIPMSDCNFQDYTLQIFDRWGAKVFETKLADQGWDGLQMRRPVGSGVYLYHLQFSVEENGRMRKEELLGEVVVVR